MEPGAVVLIVLAVLGAALVMVLGFVLFNRYADTHQSLPCAFRAEESAGWRRGALSYDSGRLDHFGRGGPFRVPDHRWDRAALSFGIARSLEATEVPWLTGPVLAVPCEYGTDRFELALGLEHYTALRSWVESVPPGWNANVA